MTPRPTQAFGHYALRGLLGKSAATMTWLAVDRRAGTDVMLTLPAQMPVDATALARWLERTRHAARLDHPNLAAVLEVGVHESWPFIVVNRGSAVTLQEWWATHPRLAPADVAGWLRDALQGLAYAHQAGEVHGDPQLHQLLIDERGRVRLMALAAGQAPVAAARRGNQGSALAAAELRDQRLRAERDVLACGVLLYQLLGGLSSNGLVDAAAVVERLAPRGPEVLLLKPTSAVPDTLRTIVNRAVSAQERLRFRSARTFIGALTNWHTAASTDANGGLIEQLLSRMKSVGHLPALPGLAVRVERIVALESQRTDEIAGQILCDLGLSFELLRMLNTAQVQGTQIAGNGTALTLRRAIALIGVERVRRAAAGLRPWPGALDAAAAMRLRTVMDRVRYAGLVAQALRPPGYDAEVVFLITALQNLSRLLIGYHFASEAEQIERLMRTNSGSLGVNTAALPVSEEAAALTVFGIDVEPFGAAVVRSWGLGDDIVHMIRRLPADAPVHKSDDDLEQLRTVASAANEAVDVVTRTAPNRVDAALKRVTERYARALGLSSRSMHDALEAARESIRGTSAPLPSASMAGSAAAESRPSPG